MDGGYFAQCGVQVSPFLAVSFLSLLKGHTLQKMRKFSPEETESI